MSISNKMHFLPASETTKHHLVGLHVLFAISSQCQWVMTL